MRLGRCGWAGVALPLTGCGGPQSAFEPHSPQAGEIFHLLLIFLAVSAVVWIGVAATLGLGLARRRPKRGPLDLDPAAERRIGAVIASLAVATGVTVLALSLVSYLAQASVFAKPDPTVAIKVTGHQWWWEVEYESADPSQQFVTANEIHVPVGRPARIDVETQDVIHSFWAPSLNGKMDLINGQQNAIAFTPQRAGLYRGQCAEFCGQQHAFMGFEIVAEPPSVFEAWRRGQLAGAVSAKGADLFRLNGCAICHTIRGTEAAGRAGPDLTHVGSRRMIAAATIPRDVNHLAAWIADPQHIKPGAKMPSMNMSGPELLTLATYLDDLK